MTGFVNKSHPLTAARMSGVDWNSDSALCCREMISYKYKSIYDWLKHLAL
jgi:hypothetical protein